MIQGIRMKIVDSTRMVKEWLKRMVKELAKLPI